jgi:hypothetical protein
MGTRELVADKGAGQRDFQRKGGGADDLRQLA